MNFHTEPDDSDYRVRWEMIFEILAMNRTEPFLSEMGLKLPDPAAIREISREYIDMLDQSELDQSEYESEEDAKYIQEAFRKISIAMGEDTMQILHKWGMEIFPFGSDKAR